MKQPLDIKSGEQYGNPEDLQIKILSVEIQDAKTGLRKAIAKVISAHEFNQQWVDLNEEVTLEEIDHTDHTSWNLQSELWYILSRNSEGSVTFEHYR